MDLRVITRSLGPIDLRNIGRDSLLSWMFFVPVAISLILRFGLPLLQERLLTLTRFDLSDYYPLILAFYVVLLTPMLFGMLIGFLLLDEKDADTLTALQVSPLPMATYVGYRIAGPMVGAFLMTFLLFPLVNLAPLPWDHLLLLAVVAAPGGAVLALFISRLAANKVQGFALMKALGAVLMLPLIAYFITAPWQLAFGLLPTYWPVKVYWALASGAGDAWAYAIVGIAYQLLLLMLLLRLFTRDLYR